MTDRDTFTVCPGCGCGLTDGIDAAGFYHYGPDGCAEFGWEERARRAEAMAELGEIFLETDGTAKLIRFLEKKPA